MTKQAFIGQSLILRLTLALILIMHSVPGMFNGGIHDFGTLYLDPLGFAPFGLAIAWAVKLSHLASALLLILNRYIKAAALITIPVLLAGILMVHGREGWFVVGGGSNGVEYNVLLIAVFVHLFLCGEQRPQKG
jgi:putative oxidoreductase